MGPDWRVQLRERLFYTDPLPPRCGERVLVLGNSQVAACLPRLRGGRTAHPRATELWQVMT